MTHTRKKSIETQMKRDVKSFQKKLIMKAKDKGLYENFGRKEVRKLEGKYSDYRYKKEFDIIDNFSDWAMNFDDNELKREVDK